MPGKFGDENTVDFHLDQYSEQGYDATDCYPLDGYNMNTCDPAPFATLNEEAWTVVTVNVPHGCKG